MTRKLKGFAKQAQAVRCAHYLRELRPVAKRLFPGLHLVPLRLDVVDRTHKVPPCARNCEPDRADRDQITIYPPDIADDRYGFVDQVAFIARVKAYFRHSPIDMTIKIVSGTLVSSSGGGGNRCLCYFIAPTDGRSEGLSSNSVRMCDANQLHDYSMSHLDAVLLHTDLPTDMMRHAQIIRSLIASYQRPKQRPKQSQFDIRDDEDPDEYEMRIIDAIRDLPI